MQFYKRAFANTRIPGWEKYKSLMQQDAAARFAEGFFVDKAHAFKRSLESRYIIEYVYSLPPIIKDIFSLCALTVLAEQYQITEKSAEDFREAINTANRKLQPEILIEGLHVDMAQLSRDVTKHFSINFREIFTNLNNFAWALRTETTHSEKERILAYMKAGPETLREINRIYDAAEQYLAESGVETIHHFDSISTIMKMPLEAIASHLEEKLEHPRSRR